MNEITIILQAILTLDLEVVILFAVENAAAIRDLSSAVLLLAKARQIIRNVPDSNKQKQL